MGRSLNATPSEWQTRANEAEQDALITDLENHLEPRSDNEGDAEVATAMGWTSWRQNLMPDVLSSSDFHYYSITSVQTYAFIPLSLISVRSSLPCQPYKTLARVIRERAPMC